MREREVYVDALDAQITKWRQLGNQGFRAIVSTKGKIEKECNWISELYSSILFDVFPVPLD